jgi:sigma-B regulation protein RsbU (phosphoserine phosphatase)
MIDDNKLAIVAADVSGKGIPAALFMVISKTLIKNNAQYGKSPKDVFETVNKLLCENNMARMFVTAFMGFLELDTGKFTFVNAGHNPPLIKRNGGDYEFLKTKPGFVLAGMKKTKYREETITLSPGDMLYLYTDGVTEAMNPKRELFSDPKLLEVANIHKDVDLNEFIAHIKGEVDLFADGAEQADDITMVILRVLENSKSKELSISAEVENLPQVWGFVNSELEKVNAEPKLMRQVKTAVEEIFVNIAHYAYNPETGVAVVRVSVGDEIVIEFEDSGIAYNPLEREPPNVTLAAKERQIGGLGVHMVKKIMDSVEYRYEGGKNILKIGKKVVENK